MARNQALYNMLRQGLIKRGARTNIANWGAAQLMHESAEGTSGLAKDCNNYGGIVFANKPGTKRCTRSQSDKDGGRRYAAYDDMGKCLDDFVRILKLKSAVPWNAKTFSDYISRLKANGYYSDDEGAYGQKVAYMLQRYSQPAGVTAAKPAGPFQQPRTPIARMEAKGQDRRTAQDPQQVREAIAQERQRAFDKPKFSLKQWFEKLSSLEKALVLGAGGFIISRILDR